MQPSAIQLLYPRDAGTDLSASSWLGLSRPSTSLKHQGRKTWMPGTKPGMTSHRWRPSRSVLETEVTSRGGNCDIVALSLADGLQEEGVGGHRPGLTQGLEDLRRRHRHDQLRGIASTAALDSDGE